MDTRFRVVRQGVWVRKVGGRRVNFQAYLPQIVGEQIESAGLDCQMNHTGRRRCVNFYMRLPHQIVRSAEERRGGAHWVLFFALFCLLAASSWFLTAQIVQLVRENADLSQRGAVM